MDAPVSNVDQHGMPLPGHPDYEAYEKFLMEQQEAEIHAETAWLRAAEYDPRMNDPREW